ncbi:UNVERIFIED_CONTAM: hypothetical protein Sindi_0535900 [Sesamum indicum]
MDSSIRFPDLPKYDGSNDPQEHVAAFKLVMNLYGKKKAKRSNTYLFTIRQREEETLKSFMGCFDTKMLEVQDLRIDMMKYIDEEETNAIKDNEWFRDRGCNKSFERPKERRGVLLVEGRDRRFVQQEYFKDVILETRNEAEGNHKRKQRSRHNQREHVLNVKHQEDIVFGDKDLSLGLGAQNDPMVIKMDIANYKVHKGLIDNGSSVDIIFTSVLRKMDLGEQKLKPVRTPLIRFGGSEVVPEGLIDFPVSIGDEPRRKTCMVQVFVVDSSFAYTVVLGRQWLHMFRAVVSTYHLKIKFLMKYGVGEVRCDQRVATQYYNLSIIQTDLGRKEKRKEKQGQGEEAKERRTERIEPVEDYK